MLRRDSLLRRSFVLQPEGIGRKVVNGASYQVAGIALRTVLTIASTAVLARMLTPADFGYVAMAAVITDLAALLGALGFSNVLIQRRRINRLQLDTVFWATLGLGVLIASTVLALSLGAGWLFSDPRISPILQVLSIGFVISSLASVPTIVLARQLRFRTEFWINIVSIAIRTAAGIGFAVSGLGVWSLVLGGLVGHVAAVTMAYLNVPYLPRIRFHLPLLTATWRTSGSYLGNTLLHYINSNLDLFLIGRQLGATSLGYYQNARTLTDEIRARIATPVQQVIFPALSALQSEPAQVKALVMRAARLLAAFVVPVGVAISANAPELVRVLYGDQWLAMTPLLSMLGLSAALRAGTAIASPLFNASNRVALAMRFNFVGTVLLAVAILAAAPHGIEAVAAAVFLSSLYSLVTLRAALALIGLGSRQIIEILAAPTLAATAIWLTTYGLRLLAWSESASVLLLVHSAVGALVYVIVLHILSSEYLSEIKLAYLTLRR
jgi:O-antigen/teichoic acid export membrane protein